MFDSRETRISMSLGLLALVAYAAPAIGQEDCRGWARSCASVDVRVEGDRLIFYTPNMVVHTAESAEDASERVTVLPAGVSDDPYVTTPGTAAAGASVAPPNRRCDDDEPPLAVEDDEDDDCGPPVGALVLLALPASLFLLPGDSDDGTVQGPPNESGAGPGNPPSDDGAGGDGDAADDGSNSGNNNDSGNSGDTGGNSGATGGKSGSNPGSNGGGSNGGSSDDGSGDDWGPYHPEATTPGGADLPPISQVPEPISTTLFGIGLVGYAAARRRRQRTEVAD
jgi:uncharacterized membrane protein YgcG